MSKLEYGRKALPVDSALVLIQKAFKEEGVSLPEDKLFENLVRACPTITVDGDPHIRMDTLYGFFSNLQQALKHQDASWLFESRGIKTDRIVDVIEFAESREFLGQKGYLRPAIAEHLYNVFHDPDHTFIEVVYDGGIGVGKNYAADISLSYMIYILSCYYNPQVEFGLAPGSPIVFIGQSKTERLAKKVVFQKIANKIKESPYFKEFFPFNPNVNSELQFPNNISLIPVGGSDSAVLGQDVYGGCFPAGQKFLDAHGNLVTIDRHSGEKCLTVNADNELFSSNNSVKGIFTGYKQLVRLHFSNGDSIVCSKDQKFRGSAHEWIVAENARGRKFKTFDLSDLRGEGYLADSAFDRCAWDIGKGIQKNVSRLSSLWGEAIRTATKPKRSYRMCQMCSLRSRVPSNNVNAFGFSWDVFKRLQEKIPRCPSLYKRSEKGLVRKSTTACNGAAQRPGVQKGTSAWDKESGSFGARKDQRIKQRPEISEEKVFGNEKTVGRAVGKRKASSFNKNSKSLKQLLLLFPKRKADKNGFPNRNDRSLFIRFKRCFMGIRAGLYSLSGQEWTSETLCTRFSSGDSVYRSKRQSSGTERPKLGEQTKSSSFENSDTGHFERYAWLKSIFPFVRKENKPHKLGRTQPKIRETVCTDVEHLGLMSAVYDIEEVEDTHTFIAVGEKQSCGLLASNCIDEINYMEVIRGSTQTVNAGPDEVYDQAESLYNTIKNRMVSRFNEQGNIPGKLFLVSSANYDDDFTDRKRKEMEEEIRNGKKRTIYVMKLAQWESLPPERLMKETFFVEIGNENRRSRIIASKEEAEDPESVLEIPMDYHNSFLKDVDQALRDLGGIRTGVRRPFIPNKEAINRAQETFYTEVGGVGQLFLEDTIGINSIADSRGDDFWGILNRKYIDEIILDPSQVFAAHIDASLSGDSLGLAVGRIGGYTEIENARVFDDKNQDFVELGNSQVPIYRIDGLLQVTSESTNDIDLEQIRDLMLFVATQINLKWVTLDSFQSAMIIQSLKKKRIRSGVVSVDTSMAPYEELKSAFGENRILFPPHPLADKELKQIERDRKKNKVDHPSHSSKDLSDALAGSVYILQRKEAVYSKSSMSTIRRLKHTGVSDRRYAEDAAKRKRSPKGKTLRRLV